MTSVDVPTGDVAKNEGSENNTNSNNQGASFIQFPDIDKIKTMNVEQIQAILEKLIRSNDALKEEVEIGASFLSKEKKIDSFMDDEEEDIGDGSPTALHSGKGYKKRGSTIIRLRKNTQSIPVTISIEQKLEIAAKEIDYLKSAIEKENKDFEKQIEDMRSKVQEAEIEIKEVDEEHEEFQKDIVIGALNRRTNKILAEKMIKYLEDKIKLKDGLIGKLKLKVDSLKVQVKKARKQLEQREILGEELSKTDFDKLKIENDQKSLKIDELYNDLSRLKATSGKTLQVLTALMDKLTKLTSHTDWLKKQILSRQRTLKELETEIRRVLKEKEAEMRRNHQLQAQHELVKVPSVIEFVKLKRELDELKKEVTNWERKAEIASGNYKVAKQKVKKMAEKNASTFSLPKLTNVNL